MDQCTLGRTHRTVSAIGLGTWQLGADWGEVSEEQALDVLGAAVDTADVYGDGRSEQLIGRFLRDHDGLTVATKMGRRVDQVPENYRLDHFREWTDRSRRNLGVEVLDLVQLHCPPSATITDDAHTGSTSASAATAPAINVARPRTASNPAAPIMPAPMPACLTDCCNSFCARRISSRTSRDVCSES